MGVVVRPRALIVVLLGLASCSSAPPASQLPDPQASASGGFAATPTVTAPATSAATLGPAPPANTTRVCGSPSAHVYHVYRLHLLEPCKTVSGVISVIRSEADGDYHVGLTLDPQFESMLRTANRTHQHGDLVLEPICQHTITQADAVAPCAGGVAQVPIPPIGTHVSATGSYVLDEGHGGWAELHPLFEIHPG